MLLQVYSEKNMWLNGIIIGEPHASDDQMQNKESMTTRRKYIYITSHYKANDVFINNIQPVIG